MPRDASRLLPLKPLVFDALLVLADGERHGWALVRELQQRQGGRRILPGNFYRLLRALFAEGLIEEAAVSRAARERARADTGANAERRQYYRLTPLGRDVLGAEARRLERLVEESRAKRLLTSKSRS